MKILCLDFGTTLGWAAFDNNILVGSASVKLGARSKEHKSTRFIKYKNELKQLIATYTPDKIVYEHVARHVGTAAAHVYGGFLAYTHTICLESDIPFDTMAVKEIKKLATGNGNAKKQMMVDTAREEWPDVDIVDDNQADAMWIGATYITKHNVSQEPKSAP